MKLPYRKSDVKESIELYLLMSPVIVLILVFSYIPMFGIIIAFQDYSPSAGFVGPDVDWVGFDHFIDFIKGPFFSRLFGNTMRLSLKTLLFTFWVPIAFALLLNELTNMKFKKTVQTISYLPYFISAVVVGSMVVFFTSSAGIINTIIFSITGERISYLQNSEYFDLIYILTNIWKSFGFSSILYMATIAGIDGELYEAASIEGANRMHKMLYITIPMLMPTVAIMLIMAVGGLMNANTELILLIYNPSIYEKADVIGTYLYRDSLLTGEFSRGAAVGLFSTTINFALVFLANKISATFTEHSLW